MVSIIIDVLLDWKILLISLIFFGYVALVVSVKGKYQKPDKAKKSAMDELVILENAADLLKDEEPGKLYVPDSTYRTLVKEKRINLRK